MDGHRDCGGGGRGTLEKDRDRDSWEKSAQGMGPAGGPSSTREWARREARRVGAEQRDNPSARWDWRRRGSAAQGQSRRELGEREGGRDSPGASSGTIVGSDIGRAQGQSRREQGRREGQSRREERRRVAPGLRDSPGASKEGGREGQSRRELRDSCGLRYRKSSGTVDVDSQQLHTLNRSTSGGMNVMRSYQGYYTRSHQNSEVKRLWAGIVLGWVTSREVPVLHPLLIQFQTKVIHPFSQ